MNHGHVTPNKDGSKARCGGPGLCALCAQELHEKGKEGTPPALESIISKLLAERVKLLDEFTKAYLAANLKSDATLEDLEQLVKETELVEERGPLTSRWYFKRKDVLE